MPSTSIQQHSRLGESLICGNLRPPSHESRYFRKRIFFLYESALSPHETGESAHRNRIGFETDWFKAHSTRLRRLKNVRIVVDGTLRT